MSHIANNKGTSIVLGFYACVFTVSTIALFLERMAAIEWNTLQMWLGPSLAAVWSAGNIMEKKINYKSSDHHSGSK